MAIWRCAFGGYHEGRDCYEEFGRLMRHTKAKKDVQLVRLAPAEEIQALLVALGWEVTESQIRRVLGAMVTLTPTTKNDWDKLHKVTK